MRSGVERLKEHGACLDTSCARGVEDQLSDKRWRPEAVARLAEARPRAQAGAAQSTCRRCADLAWPTGDMDSAIAGLVTVLAEGG